MRARFDKSFKQSRIPWIGPVVESLLVCLPFLGVINFIFIAITMYASIRAYIEGYVPWIRLWIFLLLLTIVTIVLMFLVWKFVLSPLWAFRGEQMLEDKMETLGEIRGLISEIRKGQDPK